MDKPPKYKVTLSSWQLAQLEGLVEDRIKMLERDGLEKHSVTLSTKELLKVLNETRA